MGKSHKLGKIYRNDGQKPYDDYRDRNRLSYMPNGILQNLLL